MSFELMCNTITRGDDEALLRLLDAGQDCNAVSGDGTPVLVRVFERSRKDHLPDIKTVTLFLERGGDPNLTDALGNTPLHAIALTAKDMYVGEMEAVIPFLKLLIDAGADISICNHQGMTVFEQAVEVHNSRIGRWLLEHGAECTLHTACRLGMVDTVREALSAGEDVAAPGFGGRSALHEAVMGRSIEVAELLMSAGADVNGTDDEGRSPLHLACYMPNLETKQPKLEMVELLLRRGADPNATDANDLARPMHKLGGGEAAGTLE